MMKSPQRTLLLAAAFLVIGFGAALLLGQNRAAAHGAQGAGDSGNTAATGEPGFVDVKSLVERLLMQERYAGPREELTQAINQESEQWRQRETEWQTKYEDVTPDDPRAEEAQAEFSDLRGQYQEWRNRSNQRVNELAVEQIGTAYRQVIDTVNAIAEERGIDTVFNFTPTGDPLPDEQVLSAQTMFEVRIRSVIRSPQEQDFTDEVAAALNLPDEPAELSIEPLREDPDNPPQGDDEGDDEGGGDGG